MDNHMDDRFSRTELLIGTSGIERLKKARVAVFGVGGVGSYVVEALARSGIGTLDLIDSDTVSVSNINRQLIALTSTIGRYKVDVAKERVFDINPEATVNAYKIFYTPETATQFDFSLYDYVVDAIDTVTGKFELIMQAEASGTRIISSMGAGNKMNPAVLEVADIYATSVCPLAKVMRRELKKRGIKKLKVVYSKEEPVNIEYTRHNMTADGSMAGEGGGNNRSDGNNGASAIIQGTIKKIPGSNAFVPSVAGLIIAGEVVNDLLKVKTSNAPS